MGLQLLYTNDLHNRPAAIAALSSIKRSGALIVDGGDALGGSNTAFRLDEPILAQMRQAGYRAMAMGNREFHYFRWVQRWREQERAFPLLAANLVDLRLPPAGAAGPWQSHVFVEASGLRLALVGLTPVQYPVGSAWERLTGYRFYPPEVSLRRLLPRLASRCDEVVLMSHLGLPEDRRIAPLFPGLRLILGAHSHDVLPEPVRVGETLIVQGGSHSRFVGEINVSVNQGRLDWPSLHWRLHAVGSL